jgi:Putative Flp pilus-assembly TadE/G-like
MVEQPFLPRERVLRPVRGLSTYLRDRRGNIAIMSAMVMPAMLAFAGLGAEVATWYGQQRFMQNAADSAALAAATNAKSGYAAEAQAVAARYGFVHGVDGVNVAVAANVTCPSGATNCYSVIISKTLPLLLAQFAGYGGDAVIGGAPGKRLTSVAVATQSLTERPYCIVALAGSGAAQGIRSNGAPNANLSGCNVMSNTGATCNGHNLLADNGDAHGVSNGCGIAQNSNMPTLADPYIGLASQIPANTCGSYPQIPPNGNPAHPPLPAANKLSGTLSWSSVVQKCGDVQLTGPVTLDTDSDGAVLVIQNGRLDLNGYTFQTSSGSAVTIIFSGTAGSYQHVPSGNGAFNFRAPPTGPWSGVAIYQNPTLTTGINMTAAGNSPTWNITGLVYMPKASVTFSGAVNKSSNGASCFVMMVDNITINGTGSILATGQCDQAGLIMPSNDVPSRGMLVL